MNESSLADRDQGHHDSTRHGPPPSSWPWAGRELFILNQRPRPLQGGLPVRFLKIATADPAIPLYFDFLA
jgi:hypothetical protein